MTFDMEELPGLIRAVDGYAIGFGIEAGVKGLLVKSLAAAVVAGQDADAAAVVVYITKQQLAILEDCWLN